MRILNRYFVIGATALALLSAGSRKAHADVITTGLLYVTDYGTSELDRYSYTFDQTTGAISNITPDGIGNNATNAYFLGSSSNPIKEGIQGTTNDLIVVVGAHGSQATTLERYTLSGTYIDTIPVDLSQFNNGNVSIGNVAITPDGKYEYAPLESANEIIKIDLSTGNIVASYSMPSPHDVAIAANGDVYAANYSASSPVVVVLNSSLVLQQTLLTAAPNGVSGAFRPTGISVAADGSIYIDDNDNTATGSDSVLHYTITQNGSTFTATFDPTGSYIGSGANGPLQFTFGNNIGPDGNLYIAALGGGGGTGLGSIQSGYVDGVYELNTTSGAVSQVIAGFTEKNGPVGGSGLSAPKYLQFSTNFVNAPDPGAPEPTTTALMLVGLAGFGFRNWFKRKLRLNN